MNNYTSTDSSRGNGQISRNTQATKNNSRRNRDSKQTHNKETESQQSKALDEMASMANSTI